MTAHYILYMIANICDIIPITVYSIKEDLYEMDGKVRRKNKSFVACPVCGNPLLKSYSGIVDMRCYKCKNMIVVMVQEGVVTSFLSKRGIERAK